MGAQRTERAPRPRFSIASTVLVLIAVAALALGIWSELSPSDVTVWAPGTVPEIGG